MADTRTTCACGRTFAKPFGMRVHQRSCPVERARSGAFVKATEEGRPSEAHQDGTRAALEKMAELGWLEEEPTTPAQHAIQNALLAANDPDRIFITAQIEIDPAAWAKEYGLEHLIGPALASDMVSYVLTILQNTPGPFADVKVRWS